MFAYNFVVHQRKRVVLQEEKKLFVFNRPRKEMAQELRILVIQCPIFDFFFFFNLVLELVKNL